MTVPLCPLVLSMLEANPRRPDEVARELSGTGFAAATVTLTRLADSGLVRRRERDGRYLVTRRGRAELDLQRALWRRLRDWIVVGSGAQVVGPAGRERA